MSQEKPVIAVDVDDVLCQTAQGFADFSNRMWGHALTVDDYDEDWGKVWGTTPEVTHKRADLLHNSEALGGFLHVEEAAFVLTKLKGAAPFGCCDVQAFCRRTYDKRLAAAALRRAV